MSSWHAVRDSAPRCRHSGTRNSSFAQSESVSSTSNSTKSTRRGSIGRNGDESSTSWPRPKLGDGAEATSPHCCHMTVSHGSPRDDHHVRQRVTLILNKRRYRNGGTGSRGHRAAGNPHFPAGTRTSRGAGANPTSLPGDPHATRLRGSKLRIRARSRAPRTPDCLHGTPRSPCT